MASGAEMDIYYNEKTDLLYLRFDPRGQELRNEGLVDGVVLDIGDDDRIVGIEIVGASQKVNLGSLLPVSFRGESRRRVAPAPAAS
jgi:uncharacterized protein YuzE